jgi:hypothetical protein
MESYTPELTYSMAAIRTDGITFVDCLVTAALDVNFVREFDRLTGCNLLRKGVPIELAIDEATGRMENDIKYFCQWVWDVIFTRLPLLDGQPGKTN